jgi:hypothetical protein
MVSRRLRSPFTPRTALLFASLTIFLSMAALYIGGLRKAYMTLLSLWGVDVGFIPYIPFVDFSETLAAWQCHRLGVDVYLADPCDLLGRPHAYPPAWFIGAYTGLGPADISWLGPLLVVAFIVTVVLFSNARTYGEAAVYLAALLSQASVFAMERANIDLIMFVMVIGACALYTRNASSRIAAYSVLYAAAALKLYPAFALGLALNERKSRFLAICAAMSIAFGIYALATWRSFVELWPSIPRPGPSGETFSGLHVLQVAQITMANLPGLPGASSASWLIGYGIVIVILAVGALAVSTRAAEAMNCSVQPPLQTAIFFAGALIIVGSFFTAENVAYRGIWLLTILPTFLHFRRTQLHRRFWTIAIGLVLVLMWFECFHYNMAVAVGLVWATVFAFFVREPLWWLFIFGLMILLLIEISQSPVAGTVLRFALKPVAKAEQSPTRPPVGHSPEI